MKLLVATKRTQGQRSDDFCWCDEGEYLMFGFECSTPEKREACGCGRSLVGLLTSRGTTTAIVADVNLPSAAHLAESIYAAWQRDGWTSRKETARLGFPAKTMYDAVAMANDLIVAAMPFEVGQIIERRDLRLQVRR